MDTTTQEVEEVQTEVAPAEQAVETTTVTTETATEIVDTPIETNDAPTPIVSFDEGLKEFGFTKEELAELKAKREAEKAEAEKPIKEQSEWADKVQFGITNKLITKEDLDTHTIISKKADLDLVYENFEFENTDNLEGEELAQAKQDAFNEIYNLTSENAKAKAKGEKALQLEASELRKPINEKINKVNSDYVENQISRNFFNDRQAVLNELNEKGHTETIDVEGVKLEVHIPVKTTEAEVKEMLTSEEYAPVLKFMRDVYKDNQEGAKKVFRELIINKNKTQAIVKAVHEAAFEAGKALNNGSTAPFDRKEAVQQVAAETSKEDLQRQKRMAAGLPVDYEESIK